MIPDQSKVALQKDGKLFKFQIDTFNDKIIMNKKLGVRQSTEINNQTEISLIDQKNLENTTYQDN